MLIGGGLLQPACAEVRAGTPLPDPTVLSEIAEEVLRRGATGGVQSMPEPAWPAELARDTVPPAELEAERRGVGAPLDPALPVRPLAPARRAITVPIPAGSRTSAKPMPAEADAIYRSNSFRQAPPETARRLSFSSGVLPPANGLDPALKALASAVRAQSRPFVYGFVLLRVPPDEALEQKLAKLGVALLGPHDDHHKARMPVASLDAIAALPEVEWVGVSAREQKISLELGAVRSAAASRTAATLIPITVNLFEHDANGEFRRALEATGAAIGEYDPGLHFYRAVATEAVMDRITELDFVLFVELIGLSFGANDQSTPLIDADMIRPGASYGLTRYSGASIPVGIMDTGFMMGAYGHDDLWLKRGCGWNFTTDPAGAFYDQHGHGTHVLGTIAGTGSADSRYRGVATGVGLVPNGSIRAAKIWTKNNTGHEDWITAAMNWMAVPGECDNQPAPLVINLSGGSTALVPLPGTDERSRKLDEKVWINRQLYVVAAGNEGPSPGTVRSPGVAKNALTVGNVLDHSYTWVGDIANASSRGPTADNRMKPNVVAPGQSVTSAKADPFITNKYREDFGTSMAAPHVTGLAVTLMEHYPSFKFNPALVRAHLMATAIAHDGVPGKSNDYGLGRVSGYVAHWDHPNSDGWSTLRTWGTVSYHGYASDTITVPAGAKRLVVALTWDEPPASAGASRAVMYDVDLWVDRDGDCTDPSGACGEYASQSTVDNVEYVVVNDPPAGTYRLKVVPANVPGIVLPWGMTATIIRGNPEPRVTAYTSGLSNPAVGEPFGITVNVSTPSYLASGVYVEPVTVPAGVTPLYREMPRLDGVTMLYGNPPAGASSGMTLGNVTPSLSRSATWYYKGDSPGAKTFVFRVWSENGSDFTIGRTVVVGSNLADLLPTSLGTSPPAPIAAPGTAFSVTDTVENRGTGPSASSTMRYYLSRDAVKGSGDILLNGSRSTPALAPGQSHTATVKLTIPANTALDSYFLLGCADNANKVPEADEANNCIATPAAVVTVGKPDLVSSAVSNPPASLKRGTKFSMSDTVHNQGAVASKASATRYYLSPDAVKNTNDKLLTGSRAVPALAAGTSHSGTATVTIPATMKPDSYFVIACADNGKVVAEADENNNCRASGSKVVVTP